MNPSPSPERNGRCAEHNSVVIYSCKDCVDDQVCQECVTSTHKGHKLILIEEIVSAKRTAVENHLMNTESIKIPNLSNIIQQTNIRIDDNAKNTKSLIDYINSQSEKIKTKIDEITSNFIETCTAVQEDKDKQLFLYHKELSDLYSRLSDQAQQCRKALCSETNILLHRVEKDIETKLEQPVAPLLQNMVFTPGPLNDKLNSDGVGYLCCVCESRIESEFSYEDDITSVEVVDPNSMWILKSNAKSLSLVNHQGEIKDKLNIGCYVLNMCLSPTTSNVWCCCLYKGMTGNSYVVYEVVDSKPTQRFEVEPVPHSLCFTPQKNLVIGTENKITEFTTRGKAMRKSRSLKALPFVPRRMFSSPIIGDIVVCDDRKSVRGRIPMVLVFDRDLELKYQYLGPSKSKCEIFKYDFHPSDAIYDLRGLLLIADYNNKCIHLVGNSGHFITIIHSENERPTKLALMNDGRILIKIEERKFKVIKLATSHVN